MMPESYDAFVREFLALVEGLESVESKATIPAGASEVLERRWGRLRDQQLGIVGLLGRFREWLDRRIGEFGEQAAVNFSPRFSLASAGVRGSTSPACSSLDASHGGLCVFDEAFAQDVDEDYHLLLLGVPKRSSESLRVIYPRRDQPMTRVGDVRRYYVAPRKPLDLRPLRCESGPQDVLAVWLASPKESTELLAEGEFVPEQAWERWLSGETFGEQLRMLGSMELRAGGEE